MLNNDDKEIDEFLENIFPGIEIDDMVKPEANRMSETTTADMIEKDDRYTMLYEGQGYVGLVETMGSDQSIERAARVSYGGNEEPRTEQETRGLVRYLLSHRHTSPFEMAEVVFHVKIPIFVMRQLVRHRTANLNEYSGRYSIMSCEFFLPAEEDMVCQSTTNKQGRSVGRKLSPKQMEKWFDRYDKICFDARDLYNWSISDGVDLSREIARIVLPVSQFTELYWKMDLNNMFKFLMLRDDAHAQKEIRDMAQAMHLLIRDEFPHAFSAYEDYMKNGTHMSYMQKDLVQDLSRGKFMVEDLGNPKVHEIYNMSKREFALTIQEWGSQQVRSLYKEAQP